MAASIDLNDYWVNKNQVDDLDDLEAGVEQGTISGVDRTNMASGASIVTLNGSAPATPVNGEEWNDTSTAAGSPEVQPMIYNNASSEWLGRNIYYATTAPATTTTGWLWYDMTLKMLRMYKDATYDVHGISGWHPVQEGTYQLWTNKTGSQVSANRVVVQYTGAAVERCFTTSTNHKTMDVVGVTLEAISDGAAGVIAVVAGGAYVDIYCNVTSGNIALGDGIANSGAAGEGRTVGTLTTNPNASATVQQYGTPLGCFAQAQQASTVATITACRLLGHIGAGATYRKAAVAIAAWATGLAHANWDGGWDEVDVTNYPPSGGGSDFIASSKHKPIVGAILCADAAFSQSAGPLVTSVDWNFGKDASTVFSKIRYASSANGYLYAASAADMFVPTSAGTPYTALGNKFYWSGTVAISAGSVTVTDANLRMVGYIYTLFISVGMMSWMF